MNTIKKLFVNGKWSKLGKDALADDVSNSLLPSATAEDEGKVVSVTETGEYGLSTVESGLPVATSEDAGKVVTVGETGEYELAEGSSPSGPRHIVVTPDQTSSTNRGTYTDNWADVLADVLAGRVFLIDFDTEHYTLTFTYVDNGSAVVSNLFNLEGSNRYSVMLNSGGMFMKLSHG